MQRRDLIFRVFVSSTFSDLKAERDALQRDAFPRLRKYCEDNNARFQAIDLRWGVSQEAALDQQTMNICQEELARCQEISPKPNFIVLLGQRYGWRPLPARIPASEFEELLVHVGAADRVLLLWDNPPQAPEVGIGWYARDDNARPILADGKVDDAEYVLRPRRAKTREEYVDEWSEVESELRRILLAAVATAGWKESDTRRSKYVQSAMHQEIEAGALRAVDADRHVFAYLRTITGSPTGSAIKDFMDSGQDRTDLESLWNRLAPITSGSANGALHDENVYRYDAAWRGDHPKTDLEALCNRVYEDLKKVIDDELKQFTQATDLEREQEAHREFGKERCRHFKGREDVLSRIDDYLKDTGDNRPLVIHGTSGCGKTALMAEAARQQGAWSEEHEDKGKPKAKAGTAVRFIGATPGSADLRSLLRSLCEELGAADIPQDMNELVRKFRERMTGQSEGGKGNADAGAKPAVVFLDALDQLNDTDNARMLYWLPRDLAPGVKLVLSVLDTEPKTQAESKGWMDRGPSELCQQIWPQSLVPISKMSRQDGEDLLDAWLASVRRRLQDGQKAEVLDKFEADGRPLYLKLAFEEARLWHSWSGLPCGAHGISGLGKKVEDILVDMLQRLEQRQNHGRILVERALGGIATGRNGLTEDELLDVLSRDKDVMDDFKEHNPKSPDIDRLPVVIWSRLHASLKPYMTERRADGTNVMNFYHRQVVEVVNKRYLEPVENRLAAHNRLGDYFGDEKMDWWAESLEAQRARAKRLPPTPRPANIRKVVELPYHLLERAKLVDPESKNPNAVYRGTDAQDVKVWDAVADLLTNWQFLEAKTEADPNFDAEADRKQAAESDKLAKEAKEAEE